MSNYQDRFSDKQIKDTNTSYNKILKRIGDAKFILDIGCSGGYLDKYIKSSSNAKIWGVEIDKNDAQKASKIIDKVLTCNLENSTWKTVFGNNKFDLIICADIVEHLLNPWKFVSKLKEITNTGGRVLFSIPNVSHYSIKLNLLNNLWPYEGYGLMDRTHLHFFTYHQVVEMIESSALYIIDFDFTLSNIPNAELLKKIKNQNLDITSQLIENLFSFESHIFQFIITATPQKPAKYTSYNNKRIKSTLLSKLEIYTPTESEIIATDPTSSYASLKDKVAQIDILSARLNQIYTSRTYQLWQKYNQLKKIFQRK